MRSSHCYNSLRRVDGVPSLDFLLQRDMFGTGRADELDQYEVRASRSLDDITS